ncbi:Serine/threonine-protein kinase plk2 [Linnemannia exigua]|uniref:Serine/threonine-protein kinase plk2 n=1 Tax=Linnemannia exigua TaxID=604196 RepID=A0AAD4DGP2_9FUNG|nr:Serine/threonine-protein kinase plk2 [Linnemannia exigua]
MMTSLNPTLTTNFHGETDTTQNNNYSNSNRNSNTNDNIHFTTITATISLSGCDNIFETNNTMSIHPAILPDLPDDPALTALLAPFLDDLMHDLDTVTTTTTVTGKENRKRVFQTNKTGEKYTETEALGEGVYKVVDRLGDLFVVKAPKETVSVDMIKKEIELLQTLRGHRNTIQYFGVVHDSSGMYLRQELCLTRDLASLMAKRRFLTEPEVCYFANQLIEGLRTIHRSGFIHRDLNPENILVGEGMVLKISNFGNAIHKSEQATGFVGTVGFVAPEVVKREVHTTAMDVFSLGIIMYMMFNFKKPRITDEHGVYPPPGKFYRKIRGSKNAKDFIKSTLKIKPKERSMMMDLALHDFLQQTSCPKTLSESVFDAAPTSTDDAVIEKTDITDGNKRKAGDDGDQAQAQGQGQGQAQEQGSNDGEQKEVTDKEGMMVNKRQKLDDLTPQEKLHWDTKDFKARRQELKEWWQVKQEQIKAEEERLKAKYGLRFDLSIAYDKM